MNFFFRALAKDRGARGVGIILSGTGDDGTLGLEAIKAADGITFTQTEKSAKHAGMPVSASGAADFILPPGEIAAELIRIASRPRSFHMHKAAAEVGPSEGDEFKGMCNPLRIATDLQLVTADESMVHVRMTKGRRHDVTGHSSLFLSAIEDVTDLRAASTIFQGNQRRLRHSETGHFPC